MPPQSADRVWQAILAVRRAAGVVPCGLGARDTLRLEAAMRLYGNDIDETTTVARSRSRTGSSAGRRTTSSAPTRCARRRRTASTRKLVGFEMLDRGIAPPRLRRLRRRRRSVGVVTSGTQTPFLKKAIGMAYVPVERTRARHRVRRSTSAAAAHARASCRCRSTSERAKPSAT